MEPLDPLFSQPRARRGVPRGLDSSRPSANPSRAAVFCTALIDSDPPRYQGWIEYYTAFFAGENVDLYLFNDGPVSASLDLQGAQLVTFDRPLGRQDVWIFPGWKRSFSTAVRQLGNRYAYLGHIESDTVLLPTGRAEFLDALRGPGYHIGYTNRYRFVDTSLQILNSDASRRFFSERYADPAAFHREERFEKVVQYALRPRLLLHGERMEGRDADPLQSYTYLSQMPLPRFHALYPNGNPPWTASSPTAPWRRHLANEATRLRWSLRCLISRALGDKKYH